MSYSGISKIDNPMLSAGSVSEIAQRAIHSRNFFSLSNLYTSRVRSRLVGGQRQGCAPGSTERIL